MVQVDVFWAYGIGASFATAATYRLAGRPGAPRRRVLRWSDPYLMGTVLYCSVLFAPSGTWLLWGFPDWETMHCRVDRCRPLFTIPMVVGITRNAPITN